MTAIAPFRALRPQKKFVREVASPPYDVVSSEEARVIAGSNPYSFLHISKPEVGFPPGAADERIYARARTNLEEFRRKGIFVQDETPSFYLYSLKIGGHTQTGFVSCVQVTEFDSGRVKDHERTLPHKVEDRTMHIEAVNAQTGPIFMTYAARQSLDSIMEEIRSEPPEYDFTADDGISHTVWVVSDRARVEEIKRAFGAVDRLYIADGHHRAAAAVAVARKRRAEAGVLRGGGECDCVMAVLFPHNQLKIMDYNRAVRDLGGLSKDEFLDRVRKKFLVGLDFRRKNPSRIHEFGMYLEGEWYRLEAREGTYDPSDAVDSLDVSILQKNLLYPVLRIHDPAKDKRIRFVGGARGMNELERMVDSGAFAVAFSIYPPGIEQIIRVADEGKIMPPKSTWFEPKLRSGIFIHLLE
jgi:uncharacterized protein (DUF1015 family)